MWWRAGCLQGLCTRWHARKSLFVGPCLLWRVHQASRATALPPHSRRLQNRTEQCCMGEAFGRNGAFPRREHAAVVMLLAGSVGLAHQAEPGGEG